MSFGRQYPPPDVKSWTTFFTNFYFGSASTPRRKSLIFLDIPPFFSLAVYFFALIFIFTADDLGSSPFSIIKEPIVKQRVALYEQYADGNMGKEEFIRQRDAYRVQEDERMEQIQRLRTEKNQIFQPVKRDTDHLQTVISTVEEAGDVMHLSQNVVETFIDRIEVFNDERVKIRFTFEDVLKSYEAE